MAAHADRLTQGEIPGPSGPLFASEPGGRPLARLELIRN